MSKRKDIIDRIISRLDTIHKAAGYATDLGAHVEHFRLSPWPVSSLPAVNVKDAKSDIEATDFARTDNALSIDVEINCSNGTTTITDAYALISDVYTALALEDTSTGVLNDLARDMNSLGEDIEMDQAENIIARITIHLQVTYEAARWTY